MHIPSIKPSRLLRSFVTASLTFGFLNVVAINLPEPSGSSPPEKPPGSIMICDDSISSTILSIVSLIADDERLFTTRILVSAPAFSNALAESTSQLVPGNAGINTFGFATLFLATNIERSL